MIMNHVLVTPHVATEKSRIVISRWTDGTLGYGASALYGVSDDSCVLGYCARCTAEGFPDSPQDHRSHDIQNTTGSFVTR